VIKTLEINKSNHFVENLDELTLYISFQEYVPYDLKDAFCPGTYALDNFENLFDLLVMNL